MLKGSHLFRVRLESATAVNSDVSKVVEVSNHVIIIVVIIIIIYNNIILWPSPVPSPLRSTTRSDQPDNKTNKLIISKSRGERSTSGQKKIIITDSLLCF